MHDIIYDETETYIISDLYILEIQIKCNNYQSIYLSHNQICHVKKFGSNINLGI